MIWHAFHQGGDMFSTRPLLIAVGACALLVSSCLGQTFENRFVTPSKKDQQVLAAYRAGVASYSDFRTLWRFVTGPRPKWRTIPWKPDLWQGVEAAHATNKPMFIWAMNGDPLGCV